MRTSRKTRCDLARHCSSRQPANTERSILWDFVCGTPVVTDKLRCGMMAECMNVPVFVFVQPLHAG